MKKSAELQSGQVRMSYQEYGLTLAGDEITIERMQHQDLIGFLETMEKIIATWTCSMVEMGFNKCQRF
jgi:hypothetical protein